MSSLVVAQVLRSALQMSTTGVVAVEVLYERVAGLDVEKATLTACVRTPGPRGRRSETRTYKTRVGSLPVMRDRLTSRRRNRTRGRAGARLPVAAEIGDITRFFTAKELVGYAGLCPTVDQSGGHD